MKPIADIIKDLRALVTPGPASPPRASQKQKHGWDEEDATYRSAWGKDGKKPYGIPLRAAFYQFLPEAPRHTRPNVDACKMYVNRIDEVLEMDCWSARERDRLRVLRGIWRRRADGLDARYLQHGNVGGRNNRQDREARPGSARQIFEAAYEAVMESRGKTKGAGPRTKFITDPKWPLGKPNPDRRA